MKSRPAGQFIVIIFHSIFGILYKEGIVCIVNLADCKPSLIIHVLIRIEGRPFTAICHKLKYENTYAQKQRCCKSKANDTSLL